MKIRFRFGAIFFGEGQELVPHLDKMSVTTDRKSWTSVMVTFPTLRIRIQ